MPEPEATPTLKADQQTIETGILDRLTDQDDQRPWSVTELIRDIGEQIGTEDAITNLHGLGLINRCGDLIFPTRAALRAAQLKW